MELELGRSMNASLEVVIGKLSLQNLGLQNSAVIKGME
jgi:hypothetical protein